ncbi:MAG: hypothetical protein KUG83_09185 [Gammaproteobacteria bacterium]|nr:hypothetical protein [Gammaproteobacteria bacterium]
MTTLPDNIRLLYIEDKQGITIVALENEDVDLPFFSFRLEAPNKTAAFASNARLK